MKKIVALFGLCAVMACGVAIAANGQAISKAKTACQNNPTQCSQAKADAKKEAQAAKDACAKNQSACDSAKAKARSAVKQ